MFNVHIPTTWTCNLQKLTSIFTQQLFEISTFIKCQLESTYVELIIVVCIFLVFFDGMSFEQSFVRVLMHRNTKHCCLTRWRSLHVSPHRAFNQGASLSSPCHSETCVFVLPLVVISIKILLYVSKARSKVMELKLPGISPNLEGLRIKLPCLRCTAATSEHKSVDSYYA